MTLDAATAAVTDLLQRVADSHDPELMLSAAARRIVGQLAATAQASDDPEVRHLLGWSEWFRYLALPDDEDDEAWYAAAEFLTGCFVVEHCSPPEPLVPVCAHYAAERAEELLSDAMRDDDPEALADALALWRRVVAATPSDNPRLPAMLCNLAVGIQTRFGRSADLADLDDAVAMLRRAIESVTDGDERYRVIASNLAGALQQRFLMTGVRDDLDEMAALMRKVVGSGSLDVAETARQQVNLGVALVTRFERYGALTDLDEALTALIDASSTFSETGEAELPITLSSLGVALKMRFDRVPTLDTLDLAVRVGRLAVDAAPDDLAGRHRILANLATSLRHRAERRKDVTDIDSAVDASRAALTATPEGHPDVASIRSNLAMTLLTRYELGGAIVDLNDAVRAAGDGLSEAPADSPITALRKANLAHVLLVRHRRLGSPTDREHALTALLTVAYHSNAAPIVRIRTARVAAELIDGSDPSVAANLLELALGLVPVIASRALGRSDQEFMLSSVAGLARDTAAMAMATRGTSAGPAAALPMLELGRGVILGHILATRSVLSALAVHHPRSAQRLAAVRDELVVLERADAEAPVA